MRGESDFARAGRVWRTLGGTPLGALATRPKERPGSESPKPRKGVRFCPGCGQEQEEVQSRGNQHRAYCQNCKAQQKWRARRRYCARCGKRMAYAIFARQQEKERAEKRSARLAVAYEARSYALQASLNEFGRWFYAKKRIVPVNEATCDLLFRRLRRMTEEELAEAVEARLGTEDAMTRWWKVVLCAQCRE